MDSLLSRRDLARLAVEVLLKVIDRLLHFNTYKSHTRKLQVWMTFNDSCLAWLRVMHIQCTARHLPSLCETLRRHSLPSHLMASGWSAQNAHSFWEGRHSGSILQYPVSQRRQQQLADRQQERRQEQEDPQDSFIATNRLQNANGEPLIHTQEAVDLEFWARLQSWTFCERCGKLEATKLFPAFRRKAATPLHNTCKCSNATYVVPDFDGVPLLLRNLTIEDQRLLSPFDIHCGDYVGMFNGYCQRTGPFRISWCKQMVQQKICLVDDPSRRSFLQKVYDLLILTEDRSYSRFILMHFRGERAPFLYEIFSTPLYRGVECALWPALYHTTSLCESILEGQDNRASAKIAFMHKLLSPVHDFSINFEVLQYQYDRWLFKNITGAVNASKASGCSPNHSLENKSFSKTFWQHQNLYLMDAVRQYGYPSFFITISPYEWTFPFPPFLEEIRSRYFKDVTETPTIETLHITDVLEQFARGYLTGGNCNRWRTNVFTNLQDPTSKNLQTFFYRLEFQKRGTLHLHMLVWVKDISATTADLLHASVTWENARDAFTVASIQKSDKSCLPVREYPDSFITERNGRRTLQFQHTEDDAERHIRAYITTLLGSLLCRTDVQLADGKALLLKYVSSYVTKMHESATSEGLYCTDVTGYQAPHSFLRTVTPLEQEMVFQLSNIKVC